MKKDQLLFYKDQKHSKNEPEKYYKGEPAIQLDDVQVEIASNYTKKKFVFRLKLSNGAEYLFQAKDDGEMECWLNTISSTIRSQQATSSPGQSRSQTMPAKGEKMKESEARKSGAGGSGIFTLKKK